MEIGVAQIGAGKIGAGEVAPLEIHAGEIAARAFAGAAGEEILALAALRGGSCKSGDQDQAGRKPACNGINACPDTC